MNINHYLITAIAATLSLSSFAATNIAPSPAVTPGVQVKVSKSFLKIGETAELKAEATAFPKSFKWILPAGLEIASGDLTSESITVKAKAEGQMVVGIEASNTMGTTTSSLTALDVLSAENAGAVFNPLRGAKLLDYSGAANPNETPKHIVDGVTNPSDLSQKWCVSGADNWAMFDCGEFYRFYGFRIYDCCSGPEQNENIRDWRIEVSDDAEAWTVINEGSGTRINIKENYCLPVRGRYVKLIATPATNTMRIWEFEAIAASAFHLTLDVEPQSLRLNIGETTDLKVKYNLNGDKRGKDFACTVSASTSAAIIGDITDKGNEFTIPVTGGKLIGQTDLTIRVTNEGAYKEIVVPVIIDATGQPNILAGQPAELRTYADSYADGVNYTVASNTALTDGDSATDALTPTDPAAAKVAPAAHANDFMALFNSGTDAWELSKVEISLPAGHSTRSVSIIVGSDLTSLTKVHTISDIPAGAFRLEYIFPISRRARYLGILCDTEIGKAPAIAEIEAYEQISESKGLKSPLKVSGWQHDVIAEALPAGSHASTSLDSHGNYLYTTSVKSEGAIAGDSRELVTNSGTLFQLGEYDKKNACRIGFGYSGWKETLEVEETAYCSELHFLVMSTEGENNLEAQVNYWAPDPEWPDDWTLVSSDVIYMNTPDWTSQPAENLALTVGRVNNNDNIETSGVHIYEFTVKTDPTKMLASIKFANRNRTSMPTVLAVSKVVAQQQSGVAQVKHDEKKEIEGYYDLQGRQISKPTSGFYIIRYTDGSSKKVILK